MRVQGYKLNGYNATYERTLLDVKEGRNADKKCVLEVTDLQSGVTYIFEHESRNRHKNKRVPAKRDPKK